MFKSTNQDGGRRGRGVILALAVTVGGIGAGVTYNRSLLYVRGAHESFGELWTAVWKGLSGPVSYVGSEGGFAYFRSGEVSTPGTRFPNHAYDYRGRFQSGPNPRIAS